MAAQRDFAPEPLAVHQAEGRLYLLCSAGRSRGYFIGSEPLREGQSWRYAAMRWYRDENEARLIWMEATGGEVLPSSVFERAA